MMIIDKDDNTDYELKDDKGKVIFNKKICKIYHKDLSYASFISYAAAIVIVIVNQILEHIIQVLVTWVGYDTVSE